MKQKVTYKSTRCFKHFDKEASNKDLECVPFNASHIFDDVNDIFWAWEKMYEDILDERAPVRLKKCNNATGKSKFITPEIRKAMWKRNMRKRKYYKTKSSADWEAYRTIRNRVVTICVVNQLRIISNNCVTHEREIQEISGMHYGL